MKEDNTFPNILVSIEHPADVNFYKNAIDLLNKKNINTHLIVRPRGRLVQIIEKEYPNMSCTPISRYYSTLLGKIFGLLEKNIKFISFLRKNKIDAVTGFADFCVAQAAQILRKPSVLFTDDYEYKPGFYLAKFSATRLVIPASIPVAGKNIVKFNGFKELAYLHPNYFKPNENVLKEYGLKQNAYVFIREISGTSLNYKSSNSILFDLLPYLSDMGFDLLLSLENKSLEEKLENKCTILREPVHDIHSLIKYAALTISSGDTIPRESCLVGTPAIYTGRRDMCVNKELIEMGCMFKVNDIPETLNTVKNIVENNLDKKVEESIRQAIKQKWDDTTEVIVDNLMSTWRVH